MQEMPKALVLNRTAEEAKEMMAKITEFRNLIFPLSLREFGEMSGIKLRTIRSWLDGENPLPDHVFKAWDSKRVLIYIRYEIVTRLQKGHCEGEREKIQVPVKSLVLKRLKKQSKSEDKKTASDAIVYIAKLKA